jgi:hypothetical protein
MEARAIEVCEPLRKAVEHSSALHVSRLQSAHLPLATPMLCSRAQLIDRPAVVMIWARALFEQGVQKSVDVDTEREHEFARGKLPFLA